MAAPHALIAGAGIGGLSAAIGLARNGWRVSLFEKAPALEEVGAGLQLSPNASSILRRFDVLSRLEGQGLAPQATEIRRAADGVLLARVPLAEAEHRWGAPYLLAHRADLQRALLDTAATYPQITLQTGLEARGFLDSDKGVAVLLSDGSRSFECAGDCLIGADGSRSRLRQKLLGLTGDDRRFSRLAAWRALIGAELVAPSLRGKISTLWLGPQAHIVHYPLRGGSVINLVAVMAEASPFPGQDIWSSPGDPALVAQHFAGWARPVRDLIAVAPNWHKWPLFDREPFAGWTKGRVALLGDAAHAMLPFLAQGAAQAIEDADALSQALVSKADVAAALRSYAGARQARAGLVQKKSRTQGKIYHLSGPAAIARDFALRALGGRRLAERHAWLYGTD